jgi:uncharacterized protein
MSDDAPGDGTPLQAGGYAAWLAGMDAALRGERDADVACDGCTACCASSQFVHIAPDETEALAHIPATLLFPAPRLPGGHVLMGYDERGRCPMLVDGGCSIYEHRPRTCRTYDCRVFPATGVAPDDKPAIAQRARRWRFDVTTAEDRAARDAVRAAARYVRERGSELPDADRPATATQHAVVAIRLRQRLAARGAAGR